jgi:hypothetical protein
LTNQTRHFFLYFCLVLLLLARLLLPASPALAAPALLEDLHYRLAVLIWQDAARVRLTLKRLGPGRFKAEVIGKPRGFIKLLTGDQRERMETEMVWRDQRLQPLVYREESSRHGQRRLKEYRLNYPHGRLELWEWHAGKGLLKKWQTDLSGPIYDPLTAFYNCRLGIMGPTREGQTATIPGIPYPKPELMEVRLGPDSQDGRQAMLSLVNPVFADSRGVVFAYVDKNLLPRRLWTRVYGVTVHAWLLPESVIMPAALPGLTGPGPVAGR